MEEMDKEVQRIAQLGPWSDADGERVVDAWRRSGESRALFGRRYGIPVHRLYYWIAAAEKRGQKAIPRKRVKFHPVRVVPEQNVESGAGTIEIRSIRVPRGFLPDELRAVLSALEAQRYRCLPFRPRSGSTWRVRPQICGAASMDYRRSRGA